MNDRRIGPSPRNRLTLAMQRLLERMDAGTIGELAQSLVTLAPADLAEALAKMDRMQGAIEMAVGLARAEVKRRTDAARLLALEPEPTDDELRAVDRELASVRVRTDTLEDDSIDG